MDFKFLMLLSLCRKPYYDFNPSAAEVTSNAQKANDSENHLNPVMLVFIGKLSLSTLR